MLPASPPPAGQITHSAAVVIRSVRINAHKLDQLRTAGLYEADKDGDGFTDPNVTVTDCAPAAGYAEPSSTPDCDDADAGIFPGATEITDDGVDQDCDGQDASAGGTDDGEPGVTAETEVSGCGCATGHAPTPVWTWAVALVFLRKRHVSA